MSGTITDRKALDNVVRNHARAQRRTWDQAMAIIRRRADEIRALTSEV